MNVANHEVQSSGRRRPPPAENEPVCGTELAQEVQARLYKQQIAEAKRNADKNKEYASGDYETRMEEEGSAMRKYAKGGIALTIDATNDKEDRDRSGS